MKKLKLFAACSLDGYLARPDNDLRWLDEIPNPNQIDHGYARFLDTVDTLIMGRITYEVVIGFGIDWPYTEQKTFIATHNPDFVPSSPNTFTMNSDLVTFVTNLKKGRGKHIWLVGGGQIIQPLMQAELIDEMEISIIPRIIGDGIRLFPVGCPDSKWLLQSAITFDTGVTNLTYKLNP